MKKMAEIVNEYNQLKNQLEQLKTLQGQAKADNTKIHSLEELVKQLRAELEKEQVEKKEINDEKNRLIKEKDEVSVAPWWQNM